MTEALDFCAETLDQARLSFARYAERRRKSTQWAYSYVISLLLGPPALAEPPKAGKRGE